MFKTIKNRKYFSSDFDLFNLELVEKELKGLLETKFNSMNDYTEWIYRSDELLAIIEEGYCVCYAESTCNTEDEKAARELDPSDDEDDDEGAVFF